MSRAKLVSFKDIPHGAEFTLHGRLFRSPDKKTTKQAILKTEDGDIFEIEMPSRYGFKVRVRDARKQDSGPNKPKR